MAGPLVRAACARHLRDLREGPARGLAWDQTAADRALRFFPTALRLAEGEFAGKPFMLQPWQQFIVGSIFGFKTADGFRRFRNAYIEIGKSNGKTPLAAGCGLYMLTADGELGAEVYAAATTRDQAAILFRDAVHMVEASPALSKRIQKSGMRAPFNLAHLESGSFFRSVSADGKGLDGKRVHCALIDEVHSHPTPIVVDKMRAGTKARRQALIFEITNSGFDRTTIAYQHHEYSERVVKGLIEDDSWFAYVCAMDEGDQPLEDDSSWLKANPNLGISVPHKYLTELVREARGMPAKASIVQRLNFCIWTDAANPAIPGDLWRACEVDDFDEAALAGRTCVGGIDLSGTRDLTALARVYEPDADGVVHAVVEFWTPRDTLIQRARHDKVHYDLWVEQGHVIATPGRAVDYRFVAQRLSELQSEVGLQTVAFDPYRIKYLEAELAEAGVELKLVPHGQGYRKAAESELWMPRSLELLEGLIAAGKLRVKRNPALTFAAASAVHAPDPKANLIYDKRNSTGRIDGLVALAMAVGAVLGCEPEDRSVYEEIAALRAAELRGRHST
jgi:phage terminase large subunit-like protein